MCPDGSPLTADFEYECVDGEWIELYHSDPYCPEAAEAECPVEVPAEEDPCPDYGLICSYILSCVACSGLSTGDPRRAVTVSGPHAAMPCRARMG